MNQRTILRWIHIILAIPIYGYIYDVTSGLLVEVPGATEAGSPTT